MTRHALCGFVMSDSFTKQVTPRQAEYIGVKPDGPYKPDTCRY